MSVKAQFIMAALAFSLAMIWTCLTIKERSTANDVDDVENKTENVGFWKSMTEFLRYLQKFQRFALCNSLLGLV